MLTSLLAAALLGGAGAAMADCPHPYFPLQDGQTLTYRAGKTEVRVRFVEVSWRAGGQQARIELEHNGRKGETVASCSAEGVRTGVGGLETATLTLSGMQVEVLEAEGVALPPAPALPPGAQWSNRLVVELRPPKGSKIPMGAVKTRLVKEATVEGVEELEIAGRKVPALRVKNRLTAEAGEGEGESRTVESTLWFAKGLGLAKVVTGEVVDLELIGVEPRAKAQHR
jgi:hypothetical protein